MVRENDHSGIKIPSGAAICADGYIRLTLAAFRAVTLVHLLSCLDADDRDSRHSGMGASSSSIRGYTEWISRTTPAVTVGWDWQLACSEGRAVFRRTGAPRSNVMFIDETRRDCGPTDTPIQLASAIDDFDWQSAVTLHVGIRND